MSDQDKLDSRGAASERQILSQFIEKQDYAGALRQLLVLEKKRSLTPRELVLKGSFVQLASDHDLDLSEAESSYLKALEEEDEYMPAILDLGWYYYAVQDAAEKALPLFDKAISILRGQLAQAIRGKAECVEELASLEAAKEFLRQEASIPLLPEASDDGS